MSRSEFRRESSVVATWGNVVPAKLAEPFPVDGLYAIFEELYMWHEEHDCIRYAQRSMPFLEERSVLMAGNPEFASVVRAITARFIAMDKPRGRRMRDSIARQFIAAFKGEIDYDRLLEERAIDPKILRFVELLNSANLADAIRYSDTHFEPDVVNDMLITGRVDWSRGNRVRYSRGSSGRPDAYKYEDELAPSVVEKVSPKQDPITVPGVKIGKGMDLESVRLTLKDIWKAMISAHFHVYGTSANMQPELKPDVNVYLRFISRMMTAANLPEFPEAFQKFMTHLGELKKDAGGYFLPNWKIVRLMSAIDGNKEFFAILPRYDGELVHSRCIVEYPMFKFVEMLSKISLPDSELLSKELEEFATFYIQQMRSFRANKLSD